MYQEALEGFRSVGDETAEAHVLSRLAQVYLDCDDHDRSESTARECLAIAQRLPLRRLRAQALLRVGEVLLSQSRLSEAEPAMKEALAIAEQDDDRSGQVYAFIGLGQIGARLRRPDEAVQNLSSAVERSRMVGDLLARARALLALGQFHLEYGSSESAERHLIQAASMFTGQGGLQPIWRRGCRKMTASRSTPRRCRYLRGPAHQDRSGQCPHPAIDLPYRGVNQLT